MILFLGQIGILLNISKGAALQKSGQTDVSDLGGFAPQKSEQTEFSDMNGFAPKNGPQAIEYQR